MILELDNLLRQLLVTGVPSLQPGAGLPAQSTQVRFQPPDSRWSAYLSGLTVGANRVNALNVYLFDLRENRTLRSNARPRTPVNGAVQEQPAPARIDCHYLITAWSPALDVTPSVEPTLDEHRLLYEVTRALLVAAPLNATRIYGSGAGVHPAIASTDLPTQVLPPEGFSKLPDFWTAMPKEIAWRPGVYLTVTLPVVFPPIAMGPMVTTILAEHRLVSHPSIGETLATVGGMTTTPAGAAVPRAWLRVETAGGALVRDGRADEEGRFVLTGLAPGSYRFRAGSVGVGSADETFDIPSPSGSYDLRLA